MQKHIQALEARKAMLMQAAHSHPQIDQTMDESDVRECIAQCELAHYLREEI